MMLRTLLIVDKIGECSHAEIGYQLRRQGHLNGDGVPALIERGWLERTDQGTIRLTREGRQALAAPMVEDPVAAGPSRPQARREAPQARREAPQAVATSPHQRAGLASRTTSAINRLTLLRGRRPDHDALKAALHAVQRAAEREAAAL